MLEAWATPRNRTRTLIFVVIFIVFVVAAMVVGISDNAPGIALAYAGATALVISFVHPWRTAKKFGLLLLTTALGLVVFAVLHNLLEAGVSEIAGTGILHGLLQGLAVGTFLLAVFICPPGILVGLVGAIIMASRRESG